MTTQKPWEADRILDVDQARSAIRAQFPEVDATRLDYVGAGWEFDVYRTGDGWAFRFPRRAEYSSVFDWEAGVHALVEPALAPRVGIPRVRLQGMPGAEFPYPFTGHRFLPGIPADDPRAAMSQSLAAELGWALSRIHAVSAGDAAAADVKEDREAFPEWLEEVLPLAPELRGIAPAIDAGLDWLEGVSRPPPRYDGPLRFIHNDLCPDHILVDPDSGSLVGLVDWTDAALGDPALDFTVVITWRGWPFLDEVLAHYSGELDPGFRRRLSFMARALSMIWLQESLEQGSDLAKHVTWVERAFAGGDPSGYASSRS